MPAVLPEARGLPQGRRRVPCRARLRPDRQARRRRMAGREAAPALGRPRRVRRRPRSRPASRHTDDFNRGDNEGVGYFEVNQRAGMRWNATKAFLRPGLRRARTCRSGPARTSAACCSARRVGEPRRAARGRCRGLSGRWRRAVAARVRAGGEVILCDRRDRHAADPAALGHRPGAAAAAPRHRRAARAARRRRQPAGPPADPRRLRRRGREDAEHDGEVALGQGADRPRIRLQAQRPDEHGAVAARRVHAQRPGAAPIRTSSTTCSRCRSMPSASRCTASTPSPRACAT